jgi:hypothetical protein
VQKSNKKATLRPLLKIYNYLCWLALELKLFTKKKNEGSFSRNHAKCVLPPTTEKVMHVLLSSDSTDFILIDFRLLDYL